MRSYNACCLSIFSAKYQLLGTNVFFELDNTLLENKIYDTNVVQSLQINSMSLFDVEKYKNYQGH